MPKKSKYTQVKKRSTALNLNEFTTPRTSGRYRGTSIGKDKNGFFVKTHRARSKSYNSLKEIPDNDIKWIKSTG